MGHYPRKIPWTPAEPRRTLDETPAEAQEPMSENHHLLLFNTKPRRRQVAIQISDSESSLREVLLYGDLTRSSV